MCACCWCKGKFPFLFLSFFPPSSFSSSSSPPPRFISRVPLYFSLFFFPFISSLFPSSCSSCSFPFRSPPSPFFLQYLSFSFSPFLPLQRPPALSPLFIVLSLSPYAFRFFHLTLPPFPPLFLTSLSTTSATPFGYTSPRPRCGFMPKPEIIGCLHLFWRMKLPVTTAALIISSSFLGCFKHSVAEVSLCLVCLCRRARVCVSACVRACVCVCMCSCVCV